MGGLLHERVTSAIIASAFEVHSVLGYGFLEKVYQKAMQVELTRKGLTCVLEHPVTVYYKDVVVGEYYADLLVEGCVAVELKTRLEYDKRDEAQLLNELRGSRLKVGLLINMGRAECEFQRLVY